MDGVILPPCSTKKTVTIAPLPVGTSKLEGDLMNSEASEDVTSVSSTTSSDANAVETNGGRGTSKSGQGKGGASHNGQQHKSPVGLIQECETVQAFLDDTDNVLEALDQCQAEEKCLMLIKRPKESARKMLKSHSLSQLSVSDPQMYRQFNGLQQAQVHQHAQTVSPPHQDSDRVDTESVTSNSTDGTESRRRCMSAKDRQWKQSVQNAGVSVRRSSDYYSSGSDSSSSSSTPIYQYLPRRERESSRRDLRYSSIPEDEDMEINNNTDKGSSPSKFHGSQEPALPSQPDNGGNSGPVVRQDQSPSHARDGRLNHRHQGRGQGQGQGQGHGQGQDQQSRIYEQLRNGQPHSVQSERSGPMSSPLHCPRDLEREARCHSMNSLSTGLTFSLVGQRKTDSLSEVSLSSSPSQPQPQPHPHPQHCVQAARQRRGEGDYYSDAGRSPVKVHHSRAAVNSRSPRSSEGDEMFSSDSSEANRTYNGVYNPTYMQHHNQYTSNGVHHDYRPGTSTQRGPQYNGHPYNRGAGSIMAHESPQTMMAPPRPRSSVPQASVHETSERLKRFTEVMRSRMSVSSCGDMSTTSSSMSQTPTTTHTPPSRQSSATENGWDSEVSTLLDVRVANGTSSPSQKLSSEESEDLTASPTKRSVRGKQLVTTSGRVNGQKLTVPCSSQESHLCSDRQSECGQTPFSAHSHSSTMDSGYTTNTEGEGDSLINGNHHLSPPHQPYPVQNPHAHAEPYRPVPMPRNLFPTSFRKNTTSNSQNGSSSSTQQQQHHPPGSTVRPGEVGGFKGSPSHRKVPVSQGVQNSGNHSGHPQVVDNQRGSSDLAQNFKSLEMAAVTVHNDSAVPCSDEFVVKPQVMAHSGRGKEESSSSSDRCHSADRPDRQSSQENPGSFQEHSTPVNFPPPPLSLLESNSVITVPGHCNYNSANNGNSVNNNNNNNISSSVVSHSSPRSQARPQVSTTPVPTLFQLSQSYDLCSVRLSLPAAAVSASSLVTLTPVQVTLPTPSADSGSSASHSPQGHCARLGGPGSAFRPVKSGVTAQTVELTAVETTEEQCQEFVTVGELHPGDLMLEVNGWQCMGHDLANVQGLLDTTQGDVTLVVARKREDQTDHRVQQLESSLHTLEQEVERLTDELSRRDARIEELSTLLPWTQNEQTGETTLILQSDDGAFVIGENEFVV